MKEDRGHFDGIPDLLWKTRRVRWGILAGKSSVGGGALTRDTRAWVLFFPSLVYVLPKRALGSVLGKLLSGCTNWDLLLDLFSSL